MSPGEAVDKGEELVPVVEAACVREEDPEEVRLVAMARIDEGAEGAATVGGAGVESGVAVGGAGAPVSGLNASLWIDRISR